MVSVKFSRPATGYECIAHAPAFDRGLVRAPGGSKMRDPGYDFAFELPLLPLGPVHTTPFSNENGAVLLRIRLSCTLQRRKWSPKTEPFESILSPIGTAAPPLIKSTFLMGGAAVHKLGFCYFACHNVFCYFANHDHVIVKDTQAMVNWLNKTIIAKFYPTFYQCNL